MGSRLRGQTEFKGDINHPQPERHLSDTPRLNKRHHQKCAVSESERFLPSITPSVSPSSDSRSSTKQSAGKGVVKSHDCCLEDYEIIKLFDKLQRPPRLSAGRPHSLPTSFASFIDDCSLKHGERHYLASIAQIYGVEHMRQQKIQQYNQLMWNEISKGNYSSKEVNKYFKYLSRPHSVGGVAGHVSSYPKQSHTSPSRRPKSHSNQNKERAPTEHSRIKESITNLEEESKSDLEKESKTDIEEKSTVNLVNDSKTDLVKESKNNLEEESKSEFEETHKTDLEEFNSDLLKESKTDLDEEMKVEMDKKPELYTENTNEMYEMPTSANQDNINSLQSNEEIKIDENRNFDANKESDITTKEMILNMETQSHDHDYQVNITAENNESAQLKGNAEIRDSHTQESSRGDIADNSDSETNCNSSDRENYSGHNLDNQESINLVKNELQEVFRTSTDSSVTLDNNVTQEQDAKLTQYDTELSLNEVIDPNNAVIETNTGTINIESKCYHVTFTYLLVSCAIGAPHMIS
uniref:Uncharacterized protein n=1 Tax=Biomphalaria glabrata TaxID=6526 RepID=A0A2C9KR89_BIOGL